MRIRILGAAALLIAVLGMVGYSLGAPQVLAQSGTPEAQTTPLTATTPESESAATPVVETAATPVAEPVRVVTLVGWYQNAANGEFIEIGPVQTTDQLVAGPGDPTSTLTGKADLESEENNGLPYIELGDTILIGTEMFEGDPESVFNWIYYQGDPALRPATLVIPVTATAGPYEGRSGTITFLSRSSPGSGIVVIMLNPEAE
ncbi:MAG: hypothetical protein E6R14_05400 [Thermomicrobiales bacterium]|nr:MAG: hypothetical protein E6R14_05400 [Thermomicrobiales bacterium]